MKYIIFDSISRLFQSYTIKKLQIQTGMVKKNSAAVFVDGGLNEEIKKRTSVCVIYHFLILCMCYKYLPYLTLAKINLKHAQTKHLYPSSKQQVSLNWNGRNKSKSIIYVCMYYVVLIPTYLQWVVPLLEVLLSIIAITGL